MSETLLDTLRFFGILLLELIPLFMLVTFITGLTLEYVSIETLRKGLAGRKGVVGILISIVLGYITPFCSCSTIPVLAGMVKADIPIGILTAFLFASPYPVEIAIPVLAPLFGVPFAVIFLLAGGVVALLSGIAVNKIGWQDQIKPPTGSGLIFDIGEDDLDLPLLETGFKVKARRAWYYTLGFAKKLSIYIVISSAIGALIYGFLPEDLILQYAGGASLLAVPIAALIGAPIYVSAAAVVPIIYSLSLKGMSSGAVIAFLITATSISPPELLMLSGIFKRKFIALFILAMVVGAILTGYAFNLLA